MKIYKYTGLIMSRFPKRAVSASISVSKTRVQSSFDAPMVRGGWRIGEGKV